jgi:hypothetical protein
MITAQNGDNFEQKIMLQSISCFFTYDTAIFNYFNTDGIQRKYADGQILRYGKTHIKRILL